MPGSGGPKRYVWRAPQRAVLSYAWCERMKTVSYKLMSSMPPAGKDITVSMNVVVAVINKQIRSSDTLDKPHDRCSVDCNIHPAVVTFHTLADRWRTLDGSAA